MGLGRLRAVAQGYSYSYNNIKLRCTFQNNLMSWGLKWDGVLDGCARWRKVTVTVTIKVNWVMIFKGI